MRIASIICSFNTPELTDRLYKELSKNKGHDLYVLENSSKDELMYKSGKVIDLGRENIGYGGMHDYIFKNFQHYDWVGIFNNDVYDIPENYVSVLKEYMKDNVGMVSSAFYDAGTGWGFMRRKGSGARQVEFIENMACYLNTKMFKEFCQYAPMQYYGILDIALSMLYKSRKFKRIIVDKLCIGHLLGGARKKCGEYDDYIKNSTNKMNEWHAQFPYIREIYHDFLKRHETVSIIIPHYNHQDVVRRAVESALGQSTRFLKEVIVIDDGSKQEPDLNGLNIKYIKHDKNKGLASARNTGIEASTGEWILPLDADDELLQGVLENMFNHRNEADILYGNLVWRDNNIRLKPNNGNQITKDLFFINNQIFGTSLYRKEVWDNVGGYWDKHREYYEDWVFWGKAMIRGYKFKYLDQDFYLYQGKPGGMCDRLGKERAKNEQIAINHLKEYENSGMHHSV
jgi:GT2 family glycosyltransferase